MTRSHPPRSAAQGTVVLIGGREDKQGRRVVLTEVARRADRGVLAVVTLASVEPEFQWQRYAATFRELGVEQVVHAGAATREAAITDDMSRTLEQATAVFFTGGDQLELVSKLGGTPALERIRDIFEQGGLLAGTSAGAAAMGETMLVAHGPHDDSHKVESAFSMSRGLGLVGDLIIDQHFAQRARIHRLLSAVGEHPGVLGIGIDEDTGVVVHPDGAFEVIGSGAVYVVDGSGITHTNVSERTSRSTLCLFDVRLHILNHRARFDMTTRRPSHESAATSATSAAHAAAVDDALTATRQATRAATREADLAARGETS